ncbi:MAG: type I-C CRISPR-associated protein Cas8c/Csd1 [Lachnospiraceae bacterium]|nr:type I-C CRISPR-associated protein Cas8c/Csd1 [Lachnospiraceae bacterium]
MSWLNDLYLTYEVCKSDPQLLPIAHLTQNAQLEVVLDEEGNFSRASRVDKEDAVTVVPVTEDSGSRSGKAIFPHPLCDKLEYIAGDYADFVPGSMGDKFEAYIAQLGKWAQSDYSLPQIRSVYRYLQERRLMEDLREAGFFTFEDGRIQAEKQQGVALENWFVRFAVEIPGQPERRLYRDRQVFDSYIEYYLSIQNSRELCYVSGETVPCSEKHPAKIRNTADKAKLISANDASGVLTFKGRFRDSSQVASVSYEISQKAHSALRWLIARQSSLKIGEQVFVTWSMENLDMPSPFLELDWGEETEGIADGPYPDWEEEQEVFIDDAYSDWVHRAIWGSGPAPEDRDTVMVMGVEAATTGRLSIPFYQKYGAKQFIQNVARWKTETCWLSWSNKTQAYGPWSPSLIEIVKLVAGEKNAKLNKSVRERLIPCIVEGRKLPYDIVLSALGQAVNPSHFKEYWEWNRVVTITCALLRKWQIERGDGREEHSMSLNVESKDRSYIFGQLLATAEMLERSALVMGSSSNKEGMRNTAAEKYFVRFQRYPVETWATIRNQLQPYVMKLGNAGKFFYIHKLAELTDRLDMSQRDRLEPTFLQGYSSQIIEYRNSSRKQESGKEKD